MRYKSGTEILVTTQTARLQFLKGIYHAGPVFLRGSVFQLMRGFMRLHIKFFKPAHAQSYVGNDSGFFRQWRLRVCGY